MNGEEGAPAVERADLFGRPIVRDLVRIGARRRGDGGFAGVATDALGGGAAGALGASATAGTRATVSPPSDP